MFLLTSSLLLLMFRSSVLGFDYPKGPTLYMSGRLGFCRRDSGNDRDILRQLAMSNREAIMQCVATAGSSALREGRMPTRVEEGREYMRHRGPCQTLIHSTL